MQVRHIAWLTFLVRVAAAKGHAIVQNVLAGGVPQLGFPAHQVTMQKKRSCRLTLGCQGMHTYLLDTGTSWQLTLLTWRARQHACRRLSSSWLLQRRSWWLLRSGRAMPLLAWPSLR